MQPQARQYKIDGSVPTLVLQGTMIDGTGTAPPPIAALVIQGERIVTDRPSSEVSVTPGAQIIEMPGATILHGFINTHLYNTYNACNLQTGIGREAPS